MTKTTAAQTLCGSRRFAGRMGRPRGATRGGAALAAAFWSRQPLNGQPPSSPKKSPTLGSAFHFIVDCVNRRNFHERYTVLLSQHDIFQFPCQKKVPCIQNSYPTWGPQEQRNVNVCINTSEAHRDQLPTIRLPNGSLEPHSTPRDPRAFRALLACPMLSFGDRNVCAIEVCLVLLSDACAPLPFQSRWAANNRYLSPTRR